MKKIVFLFLMSVAVVGTASAQIKFGGKAGLNVSTLSNSSESTTYMAGYYVGGYVGFDVMPRLSIRPEILFSAQGAGYENTLLMGKNAKLKTYYVQVPLMVRLNVLFGFSVEAGPQVGFLASSTLKSDEGSQSATSNSNKFDFGVGVGINYKFPMLPIGFNFRYVQGFTDVRKNLDGINRIFQVGVLVGL